MLFSSIIKTGLSALMVGTAITSFTSPAIAQTNTVEPNSVERDGNSDSVAPFSVNPDFGGQSVDPGFHNYIYYLRWRDGGVLHKGKLIMNNNNYGKLIVYTNVLDRPVKQTIKLQRTRNSFILQGYNPTHPDYSADRFRFQLGNSPSDIVRVQHCSTGRCVPIRFRKETRL